VADKEKEQGSGESHPGDLAARAAREAMAASIARKALADAKRRASDAELPVDEADDGEPAEPAEAADPQPADDAPPADDADAADAEPSEADAPAPERSPGEEQRPPLARRPGAPPRRQARRPAQRSREGSSSSRRPSPGGAPPRREGSGPHPATGSRREASGARPAAAASRRESSGARPAAREASEERTASGSRRKASGPAARRSEPGGREASGRQAPARRPGARRPGASARTVRPSERAVRQPGPGVRPPANRKAPPRRVRSPEPGTDPKRPARGASGRATSGISSRVSSGSHRATRKRLRRFQELGWEAGDQTGTDVACVDVGSESVCVTTFEERFAQARDGAQPTMVRVLDPHAFRTLEPFSLEYGLPGLERWPAQDVLRGTHGSLVVPSQIGLVEFPATHVLASLVVKAREERKASPKRIVLTLPTFLPSADGARIRKAAAPRRKGAFRGVLGPVAAAYFYLGPGIDGVEAGDRSLVEWSRGALEAGRVLLLDWGASGLEYGLATVRRRSSGTTELRLNLAGIWPSLGGHRLTLRIMRELKMILLEAILAAGPADELVPQPLLEGDPDEVPRPPDYDEAFRVLRRLGAGPLPEHEAQERERLGHVVFPTAWLFPAGDEPPGYAPYRRKAVEHFKALWKVAERLKRLMLSDPARYRSAQTVSWSLGLDTAFANHAESRLEYPVADFLDHVEAGLEACLGHIDRRLARRGVEGKVHVGLLGMQSSSPLLTDGVERHAAGDAGKALAGVETCPASTDPLELKSVINRGAALLSRDKRKIDFGPPIDVLPFSVQIADCLGNVLIFSAGPIDELSVFQRRIRVEEGFPQFEFYVYDSEDGTQNGTWGAIDFHRPFEFTERDRVFAVDPRYGFGRDLPRLRDLKGDDGAGLMKRCFDRGTPGWHDGSINFRAYAPRRSAEARRLLHFLEYGLTGEFHRKVYLLEREFQKPPKRFDYIYQRYYLSRSQELLVVREWWAPRDGKLVRNKTLHTCHGRTHANEILGLQWGTY